MVNRKILSQDLYREIMCYYKSLVVKGLFVRVKDVLESTGRGVLDRKFTETLG